LSVIDISSYKGNWKGGLPDGAGVMTYKDGKKEKGIFLDGKLVKLTD
jgi:hypothetical protein